MNRIETKDNQVELWLSTSLESNFRTIFEIEMMQGFREVLEDGMVHYVIHTTDYKVEKLRAVLLQYLSKSDEIIYN